MPNRKNIFVIHSWDEAHTYRRMMSLLEPRVSGLADYSVPPWKAVPGPDDEVFDSINSRISTSTAVVVLNTPGLHRRPMSSYEMDAAVAMEKRIIVLQPHDDFWRPIPQALDDHLYRVAPWRSDVLGKAIRGEYPQDGRVFDIAEKADRRRVAQVLAAGVGAVSMALLIRSVASLIALQKDLGRSGVRVEWTGQATGQVAGYALGGAVILGGLTFLVTDDAAAGLAMAGAGGLLGAALGTHRVYKAALNGTSSLRVLTVAPC